MIVYGFSQAFRRFGGSAIFSLVSDLLTVRLGSYGSAIEELRFTACLRSLSQDPRTDFSDEEIEELQNESPGEDPFAGFDRRFDSFHKYLAQLPTVKFYRKFKRAEIKFVSSQFTAEDDVDWQPSADNCNRAMSEVL